MALLALGVVFFVNVLHSLNNLVLCRRDEQLVFVIKLNYFFNIYINKKEILIIKTVHTYYLFNLFINLKKNFFLAVLGLRCCAQAFSSCNERGRLFVAVRGLLIAVATLVAEHRL